MTKKENREKLRRTLERAERFRALHAELVRSGLTPMEAHNEAHRQIAAAV